MRKLFSVFVLAISFLSYADALFAAPFKRANYVVFYAKGDCGGEDCIAALTASLNELGAAIVSVDATSLAPHQMVDYKPITITFKDYKTAPYGPVMQKITALGYQVVSFIIHDTHTGQDVIIPH